MDAVRVSDEERAKIDLQGRAKDLLADFVPKDDDAMPSVLTRSPRNIVHGYQMWLNTKVWDEAGKTDHLVLWKLMERLKQNVSRNEDEEGFIKTCFQSISLETPTLTRVIGHALPPLLWIVFDRYPEMRIWQRTKEDATPETVELHKKWNKLVLDILEVHVQKGEEIPRKKLIARRVNDESMREAVDALSAAYVRSKYKLMGQIIDLETQIYESRTRRQREEITDEAHRQVVIPLLAAQKVLEIELETFPSL